VSADPEQAKKPDHARLNICLTSSHGGHLNEILQLADAFTGHDIFYFCYDAETTRVLPNASLIPNMAKNPIEFVKNIFRVFRLFRKERPDLIVSTGAEIALPVVFVGKLFRTKVLYVESCAQVFHPSFTGRIMYWLADEFYIQWPELLEVYGSRARLEGSLIDEEPAPS
jgi:beta-1,4-N-acetylglucosaminyltransferase